MCKVFLAFYDEISVCKMNLVARRGTVHHHIFCSVYFTAHMMPSWIVIF